MRHSINGRRVTATSLAVAATLVLAACGSSTPTQDSSTQDASGSGPAASSGGATGAADGADSPLDLTVGVLLPLTGSNASFSSWETEATKLAEKAVNDAAKAADVGLTVKVEVEDAAGKPDQAIQAATKLVTGDGASCLVGGQASAVTLGVAQNVAVPREVPEITYLSTSPSLSDLDDNGYLWRTIAPDTVQAKVLADLAAKDLGGAQGKLLNIGARNDDYGAGLANGVADQWKSLGGSVGGPVLWDPTAPNYDSEARELVDGDPAGWVIIDFAQSYQKLAPSIVRSGKWDPTRTFVTALQVPSLPDLVGPEASEGLRGLAPGVAAKSDASEAFDKYWSDNSTQTRGSGDANIFDAIVLCSAAAVAAKSTTGSDIKDQLQAVSGPGGDKYDVATLTDMFAAISAGQDVDYEGGSGSIDWNDKGDVTGGSYGVIEFKDGKLVTTDVLSES